MAIFQTIGYERSTIEALMTSLKDAKVSVVIDIRDVPISRKKGFSKFSLQGMLADNEIEYIHLKGLGTPKVGRDAARAGDFAKFQEIFEEHFESDVAQADFTKAIEHIQSGTSCLLCFERDHTKCHRSIIATRLILATGYEVEHLIPHESNGQTWKKKAARNGQSSSSKRRPKPAINTKRQSVAQA